MFRGVIFPVTECSAYLMLNLTEISLKGSMLGVLAENITKKTA